MLELAKVNKLSGLEKVKKIYFASEPMTIENDILTPTMKIKRTKKPRRQKYKLTNFEGWFV